jgi:hypothetical protein
MEELIYDEAKKYLVENLGYPSEILSREYDADFPIRGLSVDLQKGLLLKLSYIHQLGQAKPATPPSLLGPPLTCIPSAQPSCCIHATDRRGPPSNSGAASVPRPAGADRGAGAGGVRGLE